MSYPATIYSQTDVAGTTSLATDDHSARHNAVGNDLAAIEAVIGTTAGTSVLKNFTAGDFAPRINSSNVLQQQLTGTATLTSGTLNNVAIGTSMMRGGTIGTALIGTSTIQGGTANLVDMRGYFCTPQSTTCAGTGGTTTLDLSLTNEWRVTFGTKNGTLAVSNAKNGQKFVVSLTQDAVGTRTVVWFDTIKWTDAGTPTLTTTAAKRDTFGFIVTGTDTFDGYIVGKNI
jgi:hypothetical protein